MSLTEFLLARIAEDEHWLRVVEEREHERRRNGEIVPATHWFGSPLIARLLAECEVKRRIVSLTPIEITPNQQAWRVKDATARLLALPYADHSDYRKEWLP